MKFKVTQNYIIDLSNKETLKEAQLNFKSQTGRACKSNEDLVSFIIAQHKIVPDEMVTEEDLIVEQIK